MTTPIYHYAISVAKCLENPTNGFQGPLDRLAAKISQMINHFSSNPRKASLNPLFLSPSCSTCSNASSYRVDDWTQGVACDIFGRRITRRQKEFLPIASESQDSEGLPIFALPIDDAKALEESSLPPLTWAKPLMSSEKRAFSPSSHADLSKRLLPGFSHIQQKSQPPPPSLSFPPRERMPLDGAATASFPKKAPFSHSIKDWLGNISLPGAGDDSAPKPF